MAASNNTYEYSCPVAECTVDPEIMSEYTANNYGNGVCWVHGERLVIASAPIPVCPDCRGIVDEFGKTRQDDDSCFGWSHETDCRTCGAVHCDGSC